MRNVNRFFVLLVLFVSFSVEGQSVTDKLRGEEARLERKINDTKQLLAKSKSNTTSSLNELRVIENQISFRERLLKNYDNQIRSAELKVVSKEKQIIELETKIQKLKDQYKRLLLYAYKHRNKYGKMMYIFSADSYFEAIKRNKYLQKISEIQIKQFTLIKQHQRLIKEEVASIEYEKRHKVSVMDEKRKERKAIEEDKIKQEAVYQKFKLEEEVILASLKENEKAKAVLKNQIAEAIRKEIAAAELKRKKEEEAARKAALAKKEVASVKTEAESEVKTESKIPVFSDTKESEALNKSFEGNRGRLPWPVDKGTITESFGQNPHPTLKNVTTNNRGIDISAPKNAQVRAVFEGEVTSILNIPGAGKVIIIKHGNYRTVYSNLQDSYVSIGQKVSTKLLGLYYLRINKVFLSLISKYIT